MPDQDCLFLRAQLSRFPGTPLNFLIYRLTYHDNAQWTLFMCHFKRLTNTHLEKYGDADLIPHVAWDVHEDPKMEGVSSGRVRAHLRQRLKNVTTIEVVHGVRNESRGRNEQSLSIPRNTACVAVDQFCMDRIVKDLDVGSQLDQEYGVVSLISIYEDEEAALVNLSVVFPRVYALVGGLGWEMFRGEEIYSG